MPNVGKRLRIVVLQSSQIPLPEHWRTPIRGLLAGALLAIGATAALISGVHRMVQGQQEAAFWVDHAQQVLLQSASLEMHLQTAVAEARGFRLSQFPRDLRSLEFAQSLVADDLLKLRALTVDNARQQALIAGVEPLIRGRLAILRRLAGVDPAPDLQNVPPEQQMAQAADAMDRVNDGIHAIRDEEYRLLLVRRENAERAGRITTTGVGAGAAVLASSLLLIIVLIRRQRIERRHADHLRQLGLSLEQRIALRTAELGQANQALGEARERIVLAADSGRIGIWDWDVRGDVMRWDPWMYRLYGLEPSDETGTYTLWQRHLHPADRAMAERAVQDAVAFDSPYDIEFRVVWPDGSMHHLHGSGRVTRDDAGRPLRMTGVNLDVTEARLLAAALSVEHEKLLVTLQSIGDAVMTTDAEGQVTWLNPVAERLTGWRAEEAIGRSIAEVFHIVHETTRARAENPLTVCLAQGRALGLADHTLLISRHGDEFSIEDSAAPIGNAQGDILGLVLVFHDVTEQRQISGEMTYRATHDSLTGLLNRGEFEARLRHLLHNAHADRSQHALLYIDLDQFKLVNDTCGHAAGDQLLQQVAKLLSAVVRASDTLARLGGDEFAVILDHCAPEQARLLAQRICDRMEAFRFTQDDQRFRVGASIGMVPVDQRWGDIAAILQAADNSCYAAKQAGRNRVHAWFDSDDAMRARQGESQLATRLAQALDENRFVLFAQRILALQDSGDARAAVTVGIDAEAAGGLHAEVLLRMVEHDGALALPGAFLPAAERFHMAARIDRWVVTRAVSWMSELPDIGRIATLCINLSGQSLSDQAFHGWAIEALTGAGTAICQRLCLEITETSAVTNLADAAAFIAQVRTVGVRVALDDFGAGASSFGYLKTLAVDFLKIDGQFVRNLMTDPLDQAAVRCFADVAAVAGLRTVAEFVDSPEVLRKLRDMRIDFAQGYLIHRPAPIAELLIK